MTVHAVATMYSAGMSPEQIQAEFPDLDLVLFYAAVTYYLANRPRIDADIEADEKLYDELAARYPNGWRRGDDPPPDDLLASYQAMTTTEAVDIGNLIYSDPAFRNGKPCLAGTGISVQSVAIRYNSGTSPEQLQADNPDLELMLFYAAITYYLANRAQIDAQIEADAEEADRLYAEWKAQKQNGRPAAH
jgi:uncharacterized protein (DUF433 family)